MENKRFAIIVGRSDDDCGLFKQALSEQYELILTTSLNDAIVLYDKHQLKLDLVFLPLTPGNDGLNVLKKLRQLSPYPDIVIYSEKSETQIAIDALKRGADNFITLPLSTESIVAASTPSTRSKQNAGSFKQSPFILNTDFDQKLSSLEEKLPEHIRTNTPLSVEEILSLFPIGETTNSLHLADFRKEIEKNLDAYQSPDTKNHLLIVEDEDMFRTMLEHFLIKGYRTQTVEDGRSALTYLEENPDVDIVLLDIFLPDIHGTELLPKIRKLVPHAEIIIITAFEQIDVAVKTFQEGAFDYITKPVLKEDLLKVINHAKHKRFLRHALPKMGKTLLQEKLTRETKINILEELAITRQSKGKHLYMQDLYLFFPTLAQVHIPDDLQVPRAVIAKGLQSFIKELEDRASLFIDS